MLTGSLVNHLMSNNGSTTPEVGMGATELSYTDRHAGTVVEVRSPTTLVFQADKVTRTDTNGMSECQSYSYEPNPAGAKVVYTLRRNGKWVQKGASMNGPALALGVRREYHDFSF